MHIYDSKIELSYTVDVLAGVQYHFHVIAETIKPGENATLTVDIPEYGKFSLFK